MAPGGRAGWVILPGMKSDSSIRPSEGLKSVRYDIRGRLAHRARELERQGYEIISLNIGNPRAFGLRTPESMRLAMIENLAEAEGYASRCGDLARGVRTDRGAPRGLRHTLAATRCSGSRRAQRQGIGFQAQVISMRRQ